MVETNQALSQTIEDLKLRTIEHRELNVSAFESQPSPPSRRRLVRFKVTTISSNCTIPISAFESAHTLSPQLAVPQEVGNWARDRRLQLADHKLDLQEDVPVEILIGGDSY